MFFPSCQMVPEGGYKLIEVQPGVYTVVNAYDGKPDFFGDGRETKPAVDPAAGNEDDKDKEVMP